MLHLHHMAHPDTPAARDRNFAHLVALRESQADRRAAHQRFADWVNARRVRGLDQAVEIGAPR